MTRMRNKMLWLLAQPIFLSSSRSSCCCCLLLSSTHGLTTTPSSSSSPGNGWWSNSGQTRNSVHNHVKTRRRIIQSSQVVRPIIIRGQRRQGVFSISTAVTATAREKAARTTAARGTASLLHAAANSNDPHLPEDGDEEADTATSNNANDADTSSSPWLHHGLLFSSFQDGLRINGGGARAYLKYGLVRAALRQELDRLEGRVERSARASPCCGPTDLAALDCMERLDGVLNQFDGRSIDAMLVEPVAEENGEFWSDCLRLVQSPPNDDEDGNGEDSVVIRMLYIPTAMYAPRLDSSSTLGKQRQRARADGKSRRTAIVQWLERDLFSTPSAITVSVHTVTLDLWDASVKQPSAGGGTTATAKGGGGNSKGRSTTAAGFPTTAKQAVTTWNPHLVYVEGGNTFWLYDCLVNNKQKGRGEEDWVNLLRKLVVVDPSDENKGPPRSVYCGSSAGAIVAGSAVETACWKRWDDPRVVRGMEEYEDWKRVRGMGWVGPHAFFPHYDESEWESTVQEKLQQKNLPRNAQLCRLGEEDVCCVRGSSKSIAVV